jgi:hypothetical protein
MAQQSKTVQELEAILIADALYSRKIPSNIRDQFLITVVYHRNGTLIGMQFDVIEKLLTQSEFDEFIDMVGVPRKVWDSKSLGYGKNYSCDGTNCVSSEGSYCGIGCKAA